MEKNKESLANIIAEMRTADRGERLYYRADGYEHLCHSGELTPKVKVMTLSDIADLLQTAYRSECHSIERIVRDAIVSYAESYVCAPNDECEKEIKERAETAQKWLESHGFGREAIMFKHGRVMYVHNE